MEVLEVRVFEGRNVWSHTPVLQARLCFEHQEQMLTNEMPGFAERLLELLPALGDHSCALGFAGGFCERLRSGTYLGHVVEHVALELQAKASFSVRYGKTVRGPVPGTWDVVIEYGTPALGKAALRSAVELVLAILQGREFPVQETVTHLREIGFQTCFGPSAQSIVEACRKREIPVISLSHGSLLQLGYGCCRKLVQATITSQTPCLAVDLACNKVLAKRLLEDAGTPVPRGYVVTSLEEVQAAVAKLGHPVVIKPHDGNQGKGVSLNLTDFREIEAAFHIAQNYDSEVLVEEYVQGRQYRLLVIGGKLVAAAERVPAHVVGDGVHSVAELVEIANQDPWRGEGHEKPLTKLRVDPASLLTLTKSGYTLDTVPALGEVVVLRENANLSNGGTAIDVSDLVHPENVCLAVKAVQVLGLDVAGVDLVTPDIQEPATETGGMIIEVNAAPGFRMHLHPTQGKPRDVGGALVDYLFPPVPRPVSR